jgi:hypothetical protein
LTSKAQFENIFYEVFLDILNIHLNIIVSKMFFFKYCVFETHIKKILRIFFEKTMKKQVGVTPYSMIGPN